MAVWSLDEEIPVKELATLESLVSQTLADECVNLALVGLVALLALVLSTLGIYDIVSFFVTEQYRELGIRIALGAGASTIVWHVVGHGLILALAGVGLGVLRPWPRPESSPDSCLA